MTYFLNFLIFFYDDIIVRVNVLVQPTCQNSIEKCSVSDQSGALNRRGLLGIGEAGFKLKGLFAKQESSQRDCWERLIQIKGNVGGTGLKLKGLLEEQDSN